MLGFLTLNPLRPFPVWEKTFASESLQLLFIYSLGAIVKNEPSHVNLTTGSDASTEEKMRLK